MNRRPAIGVAVGIVLVVAGVVYGSLLFGRDAEAYRKAPRCTGAETAGCVRIVRGWVHEVDSRRVRFAFMPSSALPEHSRTAKVERGAAPPEKAVVDIAMWETTVARIGDAETEDSPLATEATGVVIMLMAGSAVVSGLLLALMGRLRTGSWLVWYRPVRGEVNPWAIPTLAVVGGIFAVAGGDELHRREPVVWRWLLGLGAGGLAGIALYLWRGRSGRADNGR